jgi:hypothetical protein
LWVSFTKRWPFSLYADHGGKVWERMNDFATAMMSSSALLADWDGHGIIQARRLSAVETYDTCFCFVI